MIVFPALTPVPIKKRPDNSLLGESHMADVLKKSGVRDEADDVNVGSDFYEALDDRVKELVNRAVERAKNNGRKTVKARDV